MSMLRFGFIKGKPKPKTEEDWARLYNKAKILLTGTSKITVECGHKGPGQTGAR
jgi:hypothetical protein